MSRDQQRLADFISHIGQAIARIHRYTDDMDEAGFLQNEMVQDAVIRNFEIIGEAARNIQRQFPEFANDHSEIPWDEVYLMRNRISHGYCSVDFEIVWQAVQRDVPELESLLRNIKNGPGS